MGWGKNEGENQVNRSKSIVLLAAALACAPAAENPADLVLRNGKLVTLDDSQPEAQALAVVGDRIVAVGSNREIGAYIGSATQVIDLDGQLVIPGFTLAAAPRASTPVRSCAA